MEERESVGHAGDNWSDAVAEDTVEETATAQMKNKKKETEAETETSMATATETATETETETETEHACMLNSGVAHMLRQVVVN